MKFTLFSAFLFSIGWIRVVASGDGRAPDCCLIVTDTRILVENIVSYKIQESSALCGPTAVRFHTKKGKVICSDPESDWAQRAMKIVDGRTTIKPFKEPTMCNTRTTNTIPTVTTTNKTPIKETETSTGTTAPPTVTRIETSRTETEITKKPTNQPTSISKENPESSFSTATACGTGGPTSPPAETRHEKPGIGIVTHLNTFKTTDNTGTTTPMRTKPSKLKIKILRKKSKKKLKQFQMNAHLKNKSG